LRWKEAEQEAAGKKADSLVPVKAHLVRMRDLEKLANEGKKFLAPSDLAAAEFYRLEAENLLRLARKK
jgi:hypothetical protein